MSIYLVKFCNNSLKQSHINLVLSTSIHVVVIRNVCCKLVKFIIITFITTIIINIKNLVLATRTTAKTHLIRFIFLQ